VYCLLRLECGIRVTVPTLAGPLSSTQRKYVLSYVSLLFLQILLATSPGAGGSIQTLQSELIDFMNDGVTARDAYQHALSIVRDKKPELEKHFVKNIGFGVRCDLVVDCIAH
jgi:hypothetical protein